jgi:tetratricopeptide (TPR) repeat protein
VNKGNALFKLSSYTESLECFEKALVLKPDDFEILNYKGSVLAKLSQFESALKCYERSIEVKG